MAHAALRLRRALPTLGGALRRSLSPAVPALSSFPPPALNPAISPSSSSLTLSIIQSRAFRSSPAVCLSSNGKKYHLYQEGDEITPDTILFPGCDYEHWLIVMEFPKDPKPTPEEMVRTYEETCAKGLNISLEEAKKRIYACSTTTYQGFQATMSEEESEKFQGLPGVVFVLPDSWIDPQNQEYGGDKYINGTIIPRPPPIQYNRGGRFRDRNRNPDPRRSDLQGGTMQHQQPQQENLQHNYRGPMQGDGRNYGAPQNYPPQQNYPHQQNYQPQQNYPPQQNYQPQQNYPPQQNFGTPGHGGRGGLMPNNRDHSPDGRDSYQADRRGQVPSHQPQQNYPPQQNYQPQQNYPPQQNFGTPGHGGRGSLMPNNRDHSPDGRDSYQADRRGQVPSHQGTINQGGHGDYSPQADPRGYGQSSFPGDNVNYAPPSHGGTYGQGEGERFAQVEQGNEYRGQRN